ncbi:alpha-L-arabinofuranosidase C-terminal domain-containing protein [uncultured Chitinophaga sp.]|uniref:alpha-L-arabinofuranosidase C-terminal domain-containing protein n=1 Tax=uncultured Chitinophaga sp. TaxID=339340 RepID=UPI0025E9C468|nr:alpha-L-arabinofuranosidase C-terminal domain-containing protein [uncultured Chitinophaga sp.]
MKKLFMLLGLSAPLPLMAAALHNEPDSVYIFSYATAKNNHHNGLHFAWSRDGKQWSAIGNEYAYVKSDYGRWGSEKRMLTPYLVPGANGTWHCVWSLNEKQKLFAAANSPDLIYWESQVYPQVQAGENVERPVIEFDKASGAYLVTYASKNGKYYRLQTKDFKTFGPATEVPSSAYADKNITIDLPAGKATGQSYKVAWSVVDKLIKAWQLEQYEGAKNGETTKQDAERFAGLKPVTANIVLQPANAKPISDLLMGVFFEDLNYAADGGLYAELVQNRGFEYALSDKEFQDANWNARHSWSLSGDGTFTIDSFAPIHANNPHYAVLDVTKPGAALVNSGFDGIVVKKGEKYNFSVFTKAAKAGKLLVKLVNGQGDVVAQTSINTAANNWKTATAVLTATADATDARLELQPQSAGRLQLDMVSLFPQQTFKGRKNGLRADLAQTIADIHPRFVRFPGGCVAHGDGLDNIYQWKNTIGPLEARKPQRNLWGYHQSAGLGYFEYFRFCEDIGAVPLPVVAAAVPCQNSASNGIQGGQQGGIPMDEMDAYIQDIIDLVEYANGSVQTKWGKLRAEAGHPQPFNLKYIGIGNEDLISGVFEERYAMIIAAVRKAHPEIVIIGTVGPFYKGTDYTEGWNIADKLKLPMVDEHYYNPPGWFINNQDFYDRYDRNKSKVYLGEYASHLPGRPSNIETALSEALYLTSVERNGDVVSMASYAPLLAKEGHTQWNPDLIYFNNSTVKPTVGYHVQMLYGQHAGDQYLPGSISINNNQDAVKKRIAYSIVRDSKSKDLIVKLVNMLPVTVTTNVDLAGVEPAAGEAKKIVLQGAPDDKTATPAESSMTVSGKFDTALAPYSFTVIRIKTK